MLPLDPARIAVAVAGCRRNQLSAHPCDPFAKGSRIDVLYVETPDGGTTWESPVRLTNASSGQFRTNDEPSIALTRHEAARRLRPVPAVVPHLRRVAPHLELSQHSRRRQNQPNRSRSMHAWNRSPHPEQR